MAKQRSRGTRLTLLVMAVTLIGGGVTGLSAGHLAATRIGAAASILGGLIFLRMSVRARS